jgi:hypothetical protein
MAVESSNLEAGNLWPKYDEIYSFFSFKSAENEDQFRRKMCNTALSKSSPAPVKFKRIQTLRSHLTIGSDHCVFMYFTLCLCMTTLTEFPPCFFLSCKANARVKPAKTGHDPYFS